MSKKSKQEAAKKREEYYAQFPDWYWKYGLHDAAILSISEVELVPDYKMKKPKFNYLEMELDCNQALFEQDITKIRLYNYKILSSNIDLSSIDICYWMSDTIKKQEINNKYLLEFEIAIPARPHFKHETIVVQFDFPEVERI